MKFALYFVMMAVGLTSPANAEVLLNRIDIGITCSGGFYPFWDVEVDRLIDMYPNVGSSDMACSITNASGEVSFDLREDGFSSEFVMLRGDLWGNWTYVESFIVFEVDVESYYVPTGSLYVWDTSQQPGTVTLGVSLYDGDVDPYDYDFYYPNLPPDPFYESFQISYTTPNESFVLGELGADNHNTLVDPGPVILYPGQEYTLWSVGGMITGNAATGSAVAFGETNFDIIPVPEPPQGAMLIGCSALLWQLKRRRSQ